MKTSLRLFLLAVVVTSTIGCDRVTKHLATERLAEQPAQSFLADSFRLQYAENTGGFLSMGAELPPLARTLLFTVATGLFLVALLAGLLRFRGSLGWSLGVAFVLAGGVSNWIDRVVNGRVVDFLNVGLGSFRTGIFNVADVAIMLGVGMLVVLEWSDRATRSTPSGQTAGG